jgi:hypothetical protein
MSVEGERRGVIYTVGKGEKYQSTTPPEYFRAIFEQSWQNGLRQERTVRNEDGTTRTLVVYELMVDARDEEIRRDVLTRFGLDAAQAGYNQVLSPVVIPDIYSNDTQRLSAVYFYLEKPQGGQAQPANAGTTRTELPGSGYPLPPGGGPPGSPFPRPPIEPGPGYPPLPSEAPPGGYPAE